MEGISVINLSILLTTLGLTTVVFSIPFYLCGVLYVTSVILFYTIFRKSTRQPQEINL